MLGELLSGDEEVIEGGEGLRGKEVRHTICSFVKFAMKDILSFNASIVSTLPTTISALIKFLN